MTEVWVLDLCFNLWISCCNEPNVVPLKQCARRYRRRRNCDAHGSWWDSNIGVNLLKAIVDGWLQYDISCFIDYDVSKNIIVSRLPDNSMHYGYARALSFGHEAYIVNGKSIYRLSWDKSFWSWNEMHQKLEYNGHQNQEMLLPHNHNWIKKLPCFVFADKTFSAKCDTITILLSVLFLFCQYVHYDDVIVIVFCVRWCLGYDIFVVSK